MKEVSFTYQGVSYQGFIAISTEEYPHYYWFYPDDPQLAAAVGDCVSFKVEKGYPLAPTEAYLPPYNELVGAIQAVVEQILVLSSF